MSRKEMEIESTYADRDELGEEYETWLDSLSFDDPEGFEPVEVANEITIADLPF